MVQMSLSLDFSKHARFFNQEALIELKMNCEDFVGDNAVQFAKETEWRFGNKRLGQWVCKADKEDLPLCYYLNPMQIIVFMKCNMPRAEIL